MLLKCKTENFIGKKDFMRSLDCKTVVFFANASDGPYSNERSGASVKTARENGERRKKIRLSAMFSRLTRPAGK